MTATAPQPSVQVYSAADCEALFSAQGASEQARATVDPLPVSATTWQYYYQRSVPVQRHPWWIHRDQVAGSAQALALIEPELIYFQGHFPDAPLLPGVVQINWATNLAQELLGPGYAKAEFAGLARVKFKAPVLPGLILKFELRPATGKILLKLTSHRGVHTEGRLIYRG